MRIVALDKESKQSILNDLLKRSPNNYSQYESTVYQIIIKVSAEGDKALFDYTLQFDKFALSAENIRVTKDEIAEAYAQMDENLIDVIRQSAENIRAFHQKQLRNSWFDAKPDGTILGMKITAIERAGVYVPGGKAAYPSSVLMNVIPAKVAGEDEIIMTTPPGKDGKVNPGTLVAADIAGVDRGASGAAAWRRNGHLRYPPCRGGGDRRQRGRYGQHLQFPPHGGGRPHGGDPPGDGGRGDEAVRPGSPRLRRHGGHRPFRRRRPHGRGGRVHEAAPR